MDQRPSPSTTAFPAPTRTLQNASAGQEVTTCALSPAAESQPARAGHYTFRFDGDNTLAIILSKAFFLAAGTKITDETILRQIRRPGTPVH